MRRFQIKQALGDVEDGYLIEPPDPDFTEGEVVDAASYDALAAQVAVLEAEIEAACADRCQDCNSGAVSVPAERTLASRWQHNYGITIIPCKASLIRERAYQRAMKEKV